MKIALLATGDELTTGDILNTNGQKIAQALFDAGFSLGSQVVTSDCELDIINAIKFLAQHHQVIIITGGLGPTSDDRTRFALANAVQRDLFFSEESWQAIVARLNRYKRKIHDSNRQQAYFPKGANVLFNANGTAAGCCLQVDSNLFFMLPGPPRECLPMFFEQVLPYLLTHCQAVKYKQKKWRLFGVSEGEIAAELDELVKSYPVTTGYRWDYPYLEFKLLHKRDVELHNLLNILEQRIQTISICSPEQTALEAFLKKANQFKMPLLIHDEATSGLLQHRLSQKETKELLLFVPKAEAHIHISGLNELWLSDPNITHTNISIQGSYNNIAINEIREIPFRNREVIDFAIEYIAYLLGKLL